MNCEICADKAEIDNIIPDCDKCPVPKLSNNNRFIFDLYQILNSSFVKDFNALELVFNVFNIKCSQEEALLMLTKLIKIHDLIKDYKNE